MSSDRHQIICTVESIQKENRKGIDQEAVQPGGELFTIPVRGWDKVDGPQESTRQNIEQFKRTDHNRSRVADDQSKAGGFCNREICGYLKFIHPHLPS